MNSLESADAFADAVKCGLGTHLRGRGQIGAVRAVCKAMAQQGIQAARSISLSLDPLPNDLPLAEMAERLGAMISLQLYLSPEGYEAYMALTEDTVPQQQHQQQLEQYLQVLGTKVLGKQLTELIMRMDYYYAGSALARSVAAQCRFIRTLDMGYSTCDWECIQSLKQLEHLTCSEPSRGDAQYFNSQLHVAGQNPKLRSITLSNISSINISLSNVPMGDHRNTCKIDLHLVTGMLSVSDTIELISIQYPYLLLTAAVLDDEDSDSDPRPKSAGVANVGDTSNFIAMLDQRLGGGLRISSRTVGRHGELEPAPGEGVAALIELQFSNSSYSEPDDEALTKLLLTLPPVSYPFIVGIPTCIWLPNINTAFPNCTELRLTGGIRDVASLQSSDRLRCMRLKHLGSLRPRDLQDTLQVLSTKGLRKVRITHSVNFSASDSLSLSSRQLSVLCFQFCHPVANIMDWYNPNTHYRMTKGTDFERAQFLVSATAQGTDAHAAAQALVDDVADKGFRTNNTQLRQEWFRAVAKLRMDAAIAMKVAYNSFAAAPHREEAAARQNWGAAVACFHRLDVNIGNVSAGRPLI